MTTKYPCWLTVLAILNLGLLATILRSQNNPRPGYTVQLHIHNYKNGSPDPANDQVQMIAVRSDGSSMWISRSVGDVSKGVAPMQEIVDLAKGLLIEIDHQAKISDIIPLSPTGAMRRKQLNSNRCPAMPGRPCIEGPVLLGFRTQVADISVPAPEASRNLRYVAPDLNFAVLRQESFDKRTGKPTSIWEAISAIRGEPDPSLFADPGYLVAKDSVDWLEQSAKANGISIDAATMERIKKKVAARNADSHPRP